MKNNVYSIKGNNPIVVAMSGGVDSSVAAALMNKDYEEKRSRHRRKRGRGRNKN